MLAKVATLSEIEGYHGGRPWSLKDLADAHEALDIQNEAEAEAHRKAQSDA